MLKKIANLREFPGGLLVRILCFHCCGQGSKIPQFMQCRKKKKKKERKERKKYQFKHKTGWYPKGQWNPQFIFSPQQKEFATSVSSVTQSFLTLRPHGLQHARLSCPSPTPRVYSNSCPLSWWFHPTISSSVVPFSSHLQYFPASGSFFKWVSSLHQVAKVLEF